MEKLIEWLDGERGRRLKVARELGVYPSAISNWTRVPVDHVNTVARITGIPREELRPDIFGEPEGHAA